MSGGSVPIKWDEAGRVLLQSWPVIKHAGSHLKKQQHQPYPAGENGGKLSPLVEVELSTATVPVAAVERPGILTVLLPKWRRVEVDRGFDAGRLAQLITALER